MGNIDIKVNNTLADDQLRIATYSVLQCMMRGAIGCSPQVRPEAVMLVMVHNMSRLMGEMYIGEEFPVLKFRKACRDMFVDTLKEMPVIGKPEVLKEHTAASVGIS